MLRELIESVEDSHEFITAREALASDIFVYEEDEEVIYNDSVLQDFYWRSGITKVAIIMDSFILKKGFYGYVKDTDEHGFLEPEDFIYTKWDVNYGTLEYQVYTMACKQGVSKYFAEMEALGDEVYAQEKCNYILEEVIKSEELLEKFHLPARNSFDVEDIMDDLGNHDIWDIDDHFRDEVIPYIYFTFTYDEIRELNTFLKEYSIDDIHIGNIGFFWNSKTNKYDFKMFDYSGYLDASSTSSYIREQLNS